MQHELATLNELATLTDAELDVVSAGQSSAYADARADAEAFGPNDAYSYSYTDAYTFTDEDEAYARVYVRAYASAG